jgi:hypothetical protein
VGRPGLIGSAMILMGGDPRVRRAVDEAADAAASLIGGVFRPDKG